MMKTRILHRVLIATTCVLATGFLCTGCGTAFPTHEFEVVLTDLPTGVKTDDCVVVIAPISTLKKEDLASQTNHTGQMGPDGRVHIAFRSEAAMWIWQRRQSILNFNLFLPRIQTNGWYYLYLPDLPGKSATVQGCFQDYDTWWQYRPFPNPLPQLPIAMEASRSRKYSDGYKVVLQVPVAKLPITTDVPRHNQP